MAVDLNTLPKDVQDYIKELREESADRRKSLQAYEEAFKPYDDGQRNGLMHMIKLLAEDTEEGAKLFRELANDILGDEEQSEEVDEEDSKEDEVAKDAEEKDMKTIVAEAVAEALRAKDESDTETRTKAEEEEFEAAVAHWDAEAKKLGYEPNTQEAADLFFMANKLNTSDLSEAHEKLQSFNSFVGVGEEKDEEDESGSEKPSFPKAGGKGSGAPQVKSDELDYSDADAVREALSKMLDSADA